MENYKFDRFKVNQNLYDYVLADMPKDLSALEQARYIYKRLCKKLSYSLDYFIEENLSGSPFSPTKRKLSKLSYVETVDGNKNKEVVCFVFSAIYSYILFDKGLISEEDFRENLHIKYDDFYTDHTSLECQIDGVRLRIDASMGLDMDLCLAKFGNHQLQGWKEGFLGNDKIAEEKLKTLLEKEKEEIEKKVKRENLYKNLKISEETYDRLSFNERCNLFLDSIKQAPNYSLETLTYVTEMYDNIFNGEDLSSSHRHVDSSFIYEKGELKEYLFINEKGYQNIEGGENFDSLKIYEISLKTKEIKQVERNDLLRKTLANEAIVFSSNPAKRNGSLMMNPGTTLSPNYITIQGAKNAK